jgi:hypothetical protein
MFGFGNKNRRRGRNSGGVFGGNNLRNAALAGAGIMAIRWLRNRRAAGSSGTAGTGGFGGSSTGSTGGTF